MATDVRWKQRFQNFDRGVVLLREALENGRSALSPLEKEGVIQRFEYTFDLAWKTLKDFLEAGGLVINPVTPRQVIKDAFAAKVLGDGQTWIDMLDHRNLLSHTYDFSVFEKAVDAIAARYMPVLESLHEYLIARSLEMNTPALTGRELSLIAGVLRRHPEIASAKLFGSRAKGTSTPQSDVDLAVWGDIEPFAPKRSPPSSTNCRCPIASRSSPLL